MGQLLQAGDVSIEIPHWDGTGIGFLVYIGLGQSIEQGNDAWESRIVATFYQLEKVEESANRDPTERKNATATFFRNMRS